MLQCAIQPSVLEVKRPLIDIWDEIKVNGRHMTWLILWNPSYSEALINQGKDGQLLSNGQLLPDNFIATCIEKHIRAVLRLQDHYVHSHYISTAFITDHIRHHVKYLNARNCFKTRESFRIVKTEINRRATVKIMESDLCCLTTLEHAVGPGVWWYIQCHSVEGLIFPLPAMINCETPCSHPPPPCRPAGASLGCVYVVIISMSSCVSCCKWKNTVSLK